MLGKLKRQARATGSYNKIWSCPQLMRASRTSLEAVTASLSHPVFWKNEWFPWPRVGNHRYQHGLHRPYGRQWRKVIPRKGSWQVMTTTRQSKHERMTCFIPSWWMHISHCFRIMQGIRYSTWFELPSTILVLDPCRVSCVPRRARSDSRHLVPPIASWMTGLLRKWKSLFWIVHDWTMD